MKQPEPASEYLVRLDEVIAGDLVEISIDLGFGIVLEHQCFRLAGVASAPRYVDAGAKAAAQLEELLAGLAWKRPPREGRWLLARFHGGRVELDGVDRGAVRISINQAMVDSGHATRIA